MVMPPRRPSDETARLLGPSGDAFARELPAGARVIARSSPGDPAARGGLVCWPELIVRLSVLGFAIEHTRHDGPAGAEVCEVAARKTGVRVRGYRDGDEHAIAELFQRSFHHQLTPALWQWRYGDHPLGSRRITVAVADAGTLVGHYGGYPVGLRHGLPGRAGTLQAHQIGDVMVDPSARRLGHGRASIVARMATHFWAAYGEGCADFHYGFNTGTARALQQRVVPGVRALEAVTLWVGDVTRGTDDGHGLRAARVARFDSEWDGFAARASDAYDLLTARSSAYLNWRYADSPSSDNVLVTVRDADRIVGGAVFRVRDGETQWGDALFDRQVPAAAPAALAFMHGIGAPPRTRAWFSPRPEWWVAILDRLGCQPQPEPHGLTLVYAPFGEQAALLVPGWYYTWGDSDLF